MNPVPFETFENVLTALYSPPLRAPKTLQKMRQALRELREAGAKTTADLTPSIIAAIVLARPTRSTTTTIKVLETCRAACGLAVAHGWIDTNPFSARREWLRPEEPAEKEHLTEHQAVTLLDQLQAEAVDWHSTRIFAVVATIAYTGMRSGEAFHLWRDDIDLTTQIIRIQPRSRLKTRRSAAPVPIPDELVPILADWLPQTGCQWAFPGARRIGPWNGGIPGYKPLDILQAAAARAGIEHVTFHMLRHTWATHAESLWGLDQAVTQRCLRHTRPMTTRRYQHADIANLVRKVRGIKFERRA